MVKIPEKGTIFNMLTTTGAHEVRSVGIKKKVRTVFLECLCECGTVKFTNYNKLKRGQKSCGCEKNKGRPSSNVPLSVEFPNLLLDYDFEKNEKHLDHYSKGTYQKVHWRCHRCGDMRFRSVNSRASKGYRCKICTTNEEMERRNEIKLEKVGSLQDNHPDIAAEWDHEKNAKKPAAVLSNSGQLAHWICSNGHRWETRINDRVKANSGCRKCNQFFSQYELRLMCELQALGLKVEWNQRYERVELDLFLPKLMLGIEVDGYPWHDTDEARERDKRKTEFFAAKGIVVLRYRDSQLTSLTDKEVTYEHEGNQFPSFKALLKLVQKELKRSDQLNKVFDDYLEKNSDFINQEQFHKMQNKAGVIIYRDSIASKRPDLVAEFSLKNYPLQPEQVTAHSKRMVWWRCQTCNHEWRSRVKERNRKDGRGTNCPMCHGTKSVNHTNNLITLRGDFVNFHWDFELNENRPEDYRPYSAESVYWKCPKGHSFKRPIKKVWGDQRVKKIRCTKCDTLFLKCPS